MSGATRRPERYIGPSPSVSFGSHVGVIAPMVALFSGEIAASQGVRPLGAPTFHGKIREVWMSVNASGKYDSAAFPTLSGEVYINGVSCLTTRPQIAHISGEASQHKTTKVTGDTGITQAVLNAARVEFTPGDVISAAITYSGNASSTKPSNTVIVVELEPYIPGTP